MKPETLPREVLEMVLSSASDSIIMTDENRRILYFNSESERLFGYCVDDVRGKDLNILIPARFTASHNQHVTNFIRDKTERQHMSHRGELVGLMSDGSEFPVEITISKTNTPVGIITTAIIRDVTERKKAEQVLAEKTELLRATNEELTKADEVKNQFLGMAAHDLRNPLGRIRNAAEMLPDERLSKEQRATLLRIIQSGAESMLMLVSDLLDVNRIAAGRLEIKRQDVALAQYFAVIVESHLLVAQKKNITISLTIESDSETISIDPKRIQQVVENLLSNAIKFSPRDTSILVAVTVANNSCTISVRDHGLGIPEEEIPKLFGAFQQLSPSATGGEKGTGLGLVITKKLIELHGGTITVYSDQGSGSEFVVKLPLA